MLRLFFLLLIFTSLKTTAQTADSLIGNWKFKDLYKANSIDPTKRENQRTAFKELKLELKNGNAFTAYFPKYESGTWVYDGDIRELTFISEDGEHKIKLIEVSQNSLVLEMSKGKTVELQRILTD